MEHKAMVYLEKMKLHTITAGNYVTSVNGMIHPDRIMAEHDFLYILDGTFEIWEDDIPLRKRRSSHPSRRQASLWKKAL